MTARGLSESTWSAGEHDDAGGWVPTLTGTDAVTALALVEGIADDLVTYETMHPAALDDADSLVSGRAGVALFHLYRHLATGRPEARAAATGLLEAAIDDAAAVPVGHGLGGGLAGVGFAVAHAARALGADLDEVLAGVDAALLGLVESSPWRGPFDLVDGLVGIGVYGLERLPSPAGVRLVTATIARLDERGEDRDGGITWATPPRLLPDSWPRVAPFGRYDLGMAHGVPGVVSFLAHASRAGFAGPARTLLEGAVTWLRAQSLVSGQSDGGSYPAWTVRGSGDTGPARTAWCYGDPGVAVSLATAATALERDDWLDAALALARDTARRPLAETGVLDGGVCHGAGGLGVVFGRLYQASGDPALAERARFWFRHTLALARPGMGCGGYSAWRHPHEATGRWDDEPGLLEGAAGVGLALLAASTPLAPAWDRLFLLS